MNVKEMLAAANCSRAEDFARRSAQANGREERAVVDVRDGTEVQASGKVKGAVHVSRGMLDFRADP